MVTVESGRDMTLAPDPSRPPRTLRALRDLRRRVMTDAHAQHDSIYDAVARTSTPALDGPVTGISNAANCGQLWAAIAGLLALTDGPRGRRVGSRGPNRKNRARC